jgi:hypothetical protein
VIADLKSRLAALEAKVAKLGDVTVAGRRRLETRSGLAFGGESSDPSPIYIPPRIVAVIAQPQEGHATVLVREAKYSDNLPKPCVTGGEPPTTECYYKWHGDPFAAYPAMGWTPEDYADDAYGDSALPSIDTKFFTASRTHDYWRLSSPMEAVDTTVFVTILDSLPPSNPNVKFLRVQRMKHEEETGAWIADGDPEEAECWPEFVAAHYLPMRNLAPQLIVPMLIVGDTQYVIAQHRFALGQPLQNYPQSDCAVPV